VTPHLRGPLQRAGRLLALAALVWLAITLVWSLVSLPSVWPDLAMIPALIVVVAVVGSVVTVPQALAFAAVVALFARRGRTGLRVDLMAALVALAVSVVLVNVVYADRAASVAQHALLVLGAATAVGVSGLFHRRWPIESRRAGR